MLLERHLREVVRDASAGEPPNGDEKVAEASAAIARLVRS